MYPVSMRLCKDSFVQSECLKLVTGTCYIGFMSQTWFPWLYAFILEFLGIEKTQKNSICYLICSYMFPVFWLSLNKI